jgi:hypothetical protein
MPGVAMPGVPLGAIIDCPSEGIMLFVLCNGPRRVPSRW